MGERGDSGRWEEWRLVINEAADDFYVGARAALYRWDGGYEKIVWAGYSADQAESIVRVLVDESRDGLIVEHVRDSSPGWPEPPEPRPEQPVREATLHVDEMARLIHEFYLKPLADELNAATPIYESLTRRR